MKGKVVNLGEFSLNRNVFEESHWLPKIVHWFISGPETWIPVNNPVIGSIKLIKVWWNNARV